MMMAKEIARSLAQHAEEIARYLLPEGKKVGNEWKVGNVSGESGKSLGVRLTGEKAGIWCDFATGNSGDLLNLWTQSRNLTNYEAMKEATCYLGVSQPHFDAYKTSKFVKPKQKIEQLSDKSPVMNYLTQMRKLKPETIQVFQIGQRGNEIIFPYFRDNELIFIKYLNLKRINGKKQMHVEAKCEPCLFGWQMISPQARSVIICEGEIDAMTLFQYGLPALSIPFGAGGANKHAWIEYEFERLAIFDEVFLCMDDDQEGYIATKELIERLGRHRCRVVKLPFKDANECLQAGIAAETIKDCFDLAKTLDPDELKSASLFVDQVIGEFYPQPGAFIGYSAPWAKTTDKILFRTGELSVWTGINGHGKSQFLGQIILSMMQQGARVCIASLELLPRRLLMRLTRQAAALAKPSIEYIKAIHQWYEDKLWLFDLVGSTKSKRLLDVFLYARQRYGVDVFIIDSLMKLDIADDDYNMQKIFMDQLCDFKTQHNCQIHIVVHPRKGFDESKPPSKLDIKGSGTISDLADNSFIIWRNKEKERLTQAKESGAILEEKEEKILNAAGCKWICDKQRNGDWEGVLGFWFHTGSLQYLDAPDQKPTRFVEYSKQSVSTA
jgi:twinkle protein